MKKEIIEKEHGVSYNAEAAKRFVWEHRNIFGKSRRYIISSYPPVIKEISTSPSGKKVYWFWKFLPGKYIICMFDRRPTQNEIERILTED